ncbi:unnamed protein product [Pipistrellus nathusii]|uniref:Uncharacterized protein n=1 Tax=Pipistrellus nathusii TaxID=59473 RepID=A0ABN9Z4Q1_PIPNA
MIKKAAAAVVGGALAVGAAGFTGAGIAASSLAAKMMSAAAIAHGGGVPAGSLVAVLQSAGAAGLSTSSNILLASVGSALGALLGGSRKAALPSPPAGPGAEGDQPGKHAPQANLPKPPLSSGKPRK